MNTVRAKRTRTLGVWINHDSYCYTPMSLVKLHCANRCKNCMIAGSSPGRAQLRSGLLATLAATSIALAAGSALAQGMPALYEGKAVHIGRGYAHTVVRTDVDGKPASIVVFFTPDMLKGLPKAAKGADPDFPYPLPMPTKGPKTVIDHVVINWESAGHPPEHVYDVPHFDFHFYLVSRAEQKKVTFKSENDSGDPDQQPPAELVPAGYIVPPGTAVPQMGVHAVDPSGAEFHDKPFTTTFVYGYYNKRQTFLEPMVSVAFLGSKPSFSAPVKRPASYQKEGIYPSAYSVKYDSARKRYEVTLEELK
jgi:hypothetical protein